MAQGRNSNTNARSERVCLTPRGFLCRVGALIPYTTLAGLEISLPRSQGRLSPIGPKARSSRRGRRGHHPERGLGHHHGSVADREPVRCMLRHRGFDAGLRLDHGGLWRAGHARRDRVHQPGDTLPVLLSRLHSFGVGGASRRRCACAELLDGNPSLNFVGGSSNSCGVSASAGVNNCTGGAMLVCPNGGACQITGCGLDSTNNNFFGGCSVSSGPSAFNFAAGTACCCP